MRTILIIFVFISSICRAQVVEYHPTISDAKDYSGNGHNGTLVGSTVLQVATGIRGGSYNFSASLDRITIATYALTTGTNVTIDAVLKCSQAGSQTYYQRNTGNGVGQVRLFRVTASDNLTCRLGVNAGTTTDLTATNFFTGYDAKFVFIDVYIDIPNKTVIFYRNGDWFSTQTTASNVLAINANSVSSWGGTSSANTELVGNICELRLKDASTTGAMLKTRYMMFKGMLQ